MPPSNQKETPAKARLKELLAQMTPEERAQTRKVFKQMWDLRARKMNSAWLATQQVIHNAKHKKPSDADN